MRLLVAVVVGAVGMVGVGRALAASVLDAIEVVEQPATVRLHVSGPVVVEAHRLPPNGQATDRIYVDLRGAALAPSASHQTAVTGPVLLRVRAGQFDVETARVVLDLARAVPFGIDQTEGTVTITLPAPAAEVVGSQPAPAPTAEVPAPPTEAPVAL